MLSVVYKILLAFSFLLGICAPSLGNGNLPVGLRFRNYAANSGLPGETIQAIYQDAHGLMWLGVEYAGLVSFDGEEYDIFSNDKNDERSISSNYVKCMVSDSSDVLWVGTDHGLNRRRIGPFNYYSSDFDRFLPIPNDPSSIAGKEISALLYTAENQLLIGTDKGLCVYIGNDRFLSVELTPDRIQPRAQAIIQTQSGRLFVGTDIGLFELDQSLKRINYWGFKHFRGTNFDIKCIGESSDGHLWIGAHGIYKFDITNSALTPLNDFLAEDNQFVPVGIAKIVQDDKGRMWVGTISDGLFVFFEDTNLRFIPHDVLIKGGFRGNQIRDIYTDKSGSTWVAAKNAGLNVHDSRSESFNVLYPFSDPIKQYQDNNILSMVQGDNGDLYIGSRLEGLVKYDMHDGSSSHYVNKKNDESSLVDNRVESMLKMQDGSILIGTIHGLSLYDPASDDFSKISFSATFSMVEDRNKIIWLGTSVGLFWSENVHEEILPHASGDQVSALKSRISTLYVSSDNHLWVGTANDGLLEIDQEGGEIIYYPMLQGDKGLSVLSIRAILEDEDGYLWIGTKLNGLYRFDPKSKVFTHIPDSVVEGSVFAILEDSGGNLWLTTNSHVCKLNPGNYHIEKYGKAYGLQGITLSARTRDGMFYYGGNSNLTYFNPAVIKKRTAASTVSLKFVKSDGAAERMVSKSGEYQFQYGVHLSFGFFLVDYSLPTENSFFYQLKSVDGDWIAGGNRNQVSYANLAPGDYTFSVKGANPDGVPSGNTASIKFSILPPWWLTIWARLVYFVLGVAGLYALYEILSFRTRKQHELELLRIEKEQSEKLTQHKLRFFTNISHEFRTPLTLLLAASTTVIKGISNPDLKKHTRTIARSTKNLLSLVEELIQFRTIEEGKYEFVPVYTKINKFVNNIFEEFTPMAVEKDINYEIFVAGHKVKGFVDRNIMTKIIRNLLSNAIKYTSGSGSVSVKIGEVWIERSPGPVRQDQPKAENDKVKHVRIEVIDTGVGISENDMLHIFDRFYRSVDNPTGVEGSGIGLDLVKSLVELHQGKIEVESERNKGSRFIVVIPVEFEGLLHTSNNELIEDDQELLAECQKEPEPHDEQDVRDKILIVEDDPDILSMLHDMFAEVYSVSVARNGVEGLEKALEFPQPNLIISDVAMPEMNGLEFCEQLKKNFKTNHVPVLMLTAKSTISDELAGIEAGANAYVMKPFYPEVLMMKVRGLLKNQKLLKERFAKEMHLNPSEVDIPDPDKVLLTSCVSAIENHIADQEFSVEDLAKEVGMSRTQLFRKLKYLVDLSPSEMIYSVRLKRAADLLKTENLSISEVAYMTGFSTPKSFSTTFKKHYKVSPSKFINPS